MSDEGLILEIRSVLASEPESATRAVEQRSRWLKFADMALRNQGKTPTNQDVRELTNLGRTEQGSIKKSIDSSISNYRRLKTKNSARTFRKAA